VLDCGDFDPIEVQPYVLGAEQSIFVAEVSTE